MKWVVRGLMGVAALVLLALIVVYGGSEWIMRRQHDVPMTSIKVPTDAASIAEGARIARIANCRDCHGQQGQGQLLFEVPGVGRVAPPPLAAVAATMSDAELARAIRQGVHKDGTTLFIMPTHALANLSDDDVGRIVAWIRSLKQGPGDSQLRNSFGPIGRALILSGKLPAMASSARMGEPVRPANRGRYYADIACLACHKLHEDGLMEDGATRVPALAPMASAYDPGAFRRLLHTGIGADGKEHGLMTKVARESFSELSDGEIADIQAWLKGEADKAPPR